MNTELTQSVSIKKSEFAEKAIVYENRPLSLKDYPFIRQIYDGGYKNILLKTGRQVSKSTTMACFILSESALIPNFRTLYISPSEFQTRYFSRSRVGRSLEESELLKRVLLSGPSIRNSVSVKQLGNGASIIFRYVKDNADRARGFTADRVCYDEIQDMHPDIFQIINECTVMSPYGFKTYSGTPKTTENCIEIFWQDSSQNEWLIKCDACNMWNIPSMENIKDAGMSCKKCDAILNVRNGEWVSMSGNHTYSEGFRIPQIILPWHTETKTRWDDIINKRRLYSEKVFRNEVLGESHSQGVRTLTIEDLKACCAGAPMNYHTRLADGTLTPGGFSSIISKYAMRVMGVDWSGGGQGVKQKDGTYSQVSRNVAVVLGITSNGHADVLAHIIFPYDSPQTDVVREIIALSKIYNVSFVGADAGEGNLGNSILREAIGTQRVIPFRYAGRLSRKAKWNPNVANFMLNRTQIIDNVMMCLKRKQIRFSNYDDCKLFFDDILAEYEEVTQMGEKIWVHSPRTPDDSLHALVFAFSTYRAISGELDQYFKDTEL